MALFFFAAWFFLGWILPAPCQFLALGLIGIYGIIESASISRASKLLAIAWLLGSIIICAFAYFSIKSQGLEVFDPSNYDDETASFMWLCYLSAFTGALVGVLVAWMKFCDWVMTYEPK